MRANDLTTTVLKKIIIEHIDDGDLIQSALTAYDTYLDSEIPMNFEMDVDCISLLESKIEDIKKELSKSETNKSWLTYIQMIGDRWIYLMLILWQNDLETGVCIVRHYKICSPSLLGQVEITLQNHCIDSYRK